MDLAAGTSRSRSPYDAAVAGGFAMSATSSSSITPSVPGVDDPYRRQRGGSDASSSTLSKAAGASSGRKPSEASSAGRAAGSQLSAGRRKPRTEPRASTNLVRATDSAALSSAPLPYRLARRPATLRSYASSRSLTASYFLRTCSLRPAPAANATRLARSASAAPLRLDLVKPSSAAGELNIASADRPSWSKQQR